MAGRYRALLIGNSTYPADEHNLQTLRGPVKDIAALNRALIDPQAGLFTDADVTLVPEATSSRVIRVMGGFFGTADREDVLLVYFSGHGKLDQNSRLHLCMQDTESTDLLSTAVSSARINEFADATRARNVIIVLDCCHAGAFRGGELGDAVAGPGRYVLTSCRGTQLANDATVENGTSVFTQHLVDGLLGAADDQDRDGWITFSDLYAYVNRRLREAGKQIPQQRVSGDGDLHLARSSPAAPVTAGSTQVSRATAMPPAHQGPPPVDAVKATAGSTSAQTRPRGPGRRRNVLLAIGAAVVIAAAAATTAVLLTGGSGGHSPGSTGANSHTASGPWRLLIQDVSNGTDPGCSVTLTDAQSGQIRSFPDVYSKHISYQIQAGSFRWQVTSPSTCIVTPLAGTGTGKLPFEWLQGGDTDAFAVTSGTRVAVKVTDFDGSQACDLTLRDAANGLPIASGTATPGQGHNTVTLDAGGHPDAYLSEVTCHILVSGTR
jgi:Caspase domain